MHLNSGQSFRFSPDNIKQTYRPESKPEGTMKHLSLSIIALFITGSLAPPPGVPPRSFPVILVDSQGRALNDIHPAYSGNPTEAPPDVREGSSDVEEAPSDVEEAPSDVEEASETPVYDPRSPQDIFDSARITGARLFDMLMTDNRGIGRMRQHDTGSAEPRRIPDRTRSYEGKRRDRIGPIIWNRMAGFQDVIMSTFLDWLLDPSPVSLFANTLVYFNPKDSLSR